MSRFLPALCLILLSLTAGCLPVYRPYTMTPAQQQEHDESVRKNIPPALVMDTSRTVYGDKEVLLAFWSAPGNDGRWRGFSLGLANKAQREVKIVWDETYFIENGKQNGRFMTEGIPYERRHEPRASEVVLPGQSVTFRLWPNAYVSEYVSSSRGRKNILWDNEPFGAGEYGISLVIQTAKGKKRVFVCVTLREATASEGVQEYLRKNAPDAVAP